MASDTPNPTLIPKRPLVAIGYGPRCVPVMQLTQAAAGVCDLMWLVDGSLPEMRQMSELLNRFGPVVNIAGLGVDELLQELSAPYEPDGIVTFLDANMTTLAEVAASLGLTFHSPFTALALTDKAVQRQVLRSQDLAMPPCVSIGPDRSADDLATAYGSVGWPAVLKPRSAQGSRYTFLVEDRRHLDELLDALGSSRPDMVLEGYLADDTARSDEPYASYVSVESIVADGHISHLALTGRFPVAENFRETGFFIPAVLNDGDARDALTLATSAMEALQVRTGCLHTEVKFTPEGPRVIEVNGRVGGGVPEMLDRATAAKFGLVEMILRISLGEIIRIDGPVATERIGYRFFLQPPAVSATVASISGVDTLSDHPGVDTITVHQGPGADLDWRDGSRNHIMAVVGSTETYAELQAVDRLLNKEVTVSYANVSHY
jgi:biotin carboxylase